MARRREARRSPADIVDGFDAALLALLPSLARAPSQPLKKLFADALADLAACSTPFPPGLRERFWVAVVYWGIHAFFPGTPSTLAEDRGAPSDVSTVNGSRKIEKLLLVAEEWGADWARRLRVVQPLPSEPAINLIEVFVQIAADCDLDNVINKLPPFVAASLQKGRYAKHNASLIASGTPPPLGFTQLRAFYAERIEPTRAVPADHNLRWQGSRKRRRAPTPASARTLVPSPEGARWASEGSFELAAASRRRGSRYTNAAQEPNEHRESELSGSDIGDGSLATKNGASNEVDNTQSGLTEDHLERLASPSNKIQKRRASAHGHRRRRSTTPEHDNTARSDSNHTQLTASTNSDIQRRRITSPEDDTTARIEASPNQLTGPTHDDIQRRHTTSPDDDITASIGDNLSQLTAPTHGDSYRPRTISTDDNHRRNGHRTSSSDYSSILTTPNPRRASTVMVDSNSESENMDARSPRAAAKHGHLIQKTRKMIARIADDPETAGIVAFIHKQCTSIAGLESELGDRNEKATAARGRALSIHAEIDALFLSDKPSFVETVAHYKDEIAIIREIHDRRVQWAKDEAEDFQKMQAINKGHIFDRPTLPHDKVASNLLTEIQKLEAKIKKLEDLNWSWSNEAAEEHRLVNEGLQIEKKRDAATRQYKRVAFLFQNTPEVGLVQMTDLTAPSEP